MRVRVSGNQSPFQTDGKKGVGYLASTKNCNFMLDAGSGSHSNLDIKVYENLHLILSHGHFDHNADVYNILYAGLTLGNNKIIAPNITIYVPDEYEDEIEKKNPAKQVSRIIRYNEKSKFEIDKTIIEFLKTQHSADSYAVKLTNDVMLGYSGDIGTNDLPKCSKFFQNADALICECSIPERVSGFPQHMKPQDCAMLKNQSRAKSIYLTHFFPTEPEQNYLDSCRQYTDNCYIASEGLIFDVKPKVKELILNLTSNKKEQTSEKP